jgi:hypothetical protein
MIGQMTIMAGLAIILLLGVLHLVHTFFTDKFHPRDAGLLKALQTASPVISPETTLWKSIIGFNASHSIGFIMFGLIYGWLTLNHMELLLHSLFLSLLGLCVLLSYMTLAKIFWFNVPFIGITLATLLYVAGMMLSYSQL